MRLAQAYANGLSSFHVTYASWQLHFDKIALTLHDCRHALMRSQAGLGVAVQYANQLGADWIWERIQQLAAELRSQLSRIPGVTVHDRGKLLCGIVSFTKVGPASCAQVLTALHHNALKSNACGGHHAGH